MNVEPGCLERIFQLLTAIAMLFAGVSGTPVGQPPTNFSPLGVVQYVLRPAVDSYTVDDLDAAAATISRRLTLLGFENAQVSVEDTVVRVALPGGGDTTDAFRVMTARGELELIDRDGTGEAVVTGADIVSAEAEPDQYDTGNWRVIITLSETAGDTLRAFTRDHVGQVMSIVIDGETISEPVIQAEVGSPIALTGSFSEPEARLLAVQLGGGALPFEMVIESIG